MSNQSKAELIRWNPQPTLGFQRRGVGYIIVIGNTIIQLDENLVPQVKFIRQTFLQAVEEACLLTGARIADTTAMEGIELPPDDSLSKGKVTNGKSENTRS